MDKDLQQFRSGKEKGLITERSLKASPDRILFCHDSGSNKGIIPNHALVHIFSDLPGYRRSLFQVNTKVHRRSGCQKKGLTYSPSCDFFLLSIAFIRLTNNGQYLFLSVSSTTENLAVFLWENINLHLPPSDTYELYEVKIHETDKNVVVYRGE